MNTKVKAALLIAITCVVGTAGADEPNPNFQGLISFRDGPDPTGRTPVFWATNHTLHHVVHPRAAVAKFGPNWVGQITWCGNSAGQPNPGACSEIYNQFARGRAIDENTISLIPVR
ncbi:hypothetical protein LJR289_002011 [Pseudoduganella sp. LjRoot289]|uniref:hypothetical protein n=1 Tax=Pseudoduganella sp. LjRoot289 TaxID=3342314 RepID=UPI003ED09CE3